MPALKDHPGKGLQMDLFSQNNSKRENLEKCVKMADLEQLSTKELQELAFLPCGGIPAGPEQIKKIDIWMAANKEARRRNAAIEKNTFVAKGSAQRWFASWLPTSPAIQEIADGLEAALDVVEALYPSILARGMGHAEDMNILMAQRCGKAEGILAKMAPYDQSCVHLEIHSVTGPWNFDPAEGTPEFEPGAKSHVFHLAYEKLPTQETLEADICTYLLVRDPSNLWENKHGKNHFYTSEGLTGPTTKNGIPLHKPWTNLSPEEQTTLINTAAPN